jgi:signal transduction histidine kinase
MKMIRKIQKRLSPPVFQGEAEKTRVAALLHTNLVTCTVAMFTLMIVSALNIGIFAGALPVMLVDVLILLVLQIPLRCGYVRLTSLILVALLTVSISGFIYQAGTIRTPAAAVYMVLSSLLAGLLISRRAAVMSACLNCVIFCGFFLAEVNGLLPPAMLSNLVQVIAFGFGAIWAVVLMNQATRSIDDSWALAQSELAEHRRADARAHYRSVTLERVIRLGKNVTEVTDFRNTLLKIWAGIRSELDFDRVGIFLYNPVDNTMDGMLGTDRVGNLIGIENLKFSLTPGDPFQILLSRPDGFQFTHNYGANPDRLPSEAMMGVKEHVSVAVWAGDKPVALITADQLVTQRPILEEQLEALRLFAGYAGLAIENSRLKSELEQRVLERTIELEAANRELESFSYSVSHDLRAPLRVINGFSKILNDDFSAEFSSSAQDMLKKLRESGLKMGQLIEALLDFSRLGRKPLILLPVDMNFIVRTAIDALSLETCERSIEWNLAELPVASADPALIQQVYANLIGNAIKYSCKREQARIEIGCMEQDGGVVYYVRDNGAGFDMQYADRLFGVFQRLHRDDEFEGTGIGLAIVRRIVQRHGGRVWAEAEVDKGAAFYFTLAPGAPESHPE